ncbi:hypothetical protein LUZ60_005338 [Juncus effusus]|nr:hypothetical protein LUZ60_005338 [Juncus effusus]
MAYLGFEETELRLGLPGDASKLKACRKREFEETVDLKLELKLQTVISKEEKIRETLVKPACPSPKARAVGWPPVRSYRKNIMAEKAISKESFVKVSMDGAPYLRKVDLNMNKNYKDLSQTLEKLFDSFTSNCNNGGSVDLKNGFSEYVTTYEDKDGDWMLVGDVPWNMFVESCKRLRLIKGSEAKGFAPKSTEKFNNRS